MLRDANAAVLDERAAQTETNDRRSCQPDLRRALERHALTLEYQPIVGLRQGDVRGFAAVLRWPGRDGTPTTDSADAIGAWLLQHACVEARYWPGLGISVEVMPGQLESGALLDQVMTALATSGLAPERLDLALGDVKSLTRSAGTFAALRRRGVGLVLGDSAGPDEKLPAFLTALKVPAALVAELPLDGAAARQAQRLVERGKTAGLTIMADGVETLAQREFLCRLGCDCARGPLYSRPLPPDRLAALLDYGVDTCSARRTTPETLYERVDPH